MRALAAALLLTALPAFAAEPKRPYTIDDHYRLAGVSDPAISPDGSRIAWVVSHTDLPAGERWSEIWIAAADGTGARALTRGRHHDGSPRFSPDGRTLAFVSDREKDTPQVYLLPLDGGDPRRLTTHPLGAGEPAWSPDGRFVAFAADVYPECGADAACNEKIETSRTGGPLEAHMADELLYRHWTSWRDGKYAHILLTRVADGATVDLTPGRFDSPIFSVSGELGFAFAPDGRELAFVSNREKDQASTTNADLWLLPLDAEGRPGEPVNVTAANRGWDGSPAYSPDGGRIAYRTQLVPGYESDRFRAAVYDRAAKTSRVLTEGFDAWVNGLAFAPDGRLFFLSELAARTPLFELPLDGGAPREALRHGTIDGWRLDPSGRSVVYVARTVSQPAEVFRAPLTQGSGPSPGGAPAVLSHHNDDVVAAVDIRPAEELWIDAGGGRKVHTFVVKPYGFDPGKKYPLIVNVHGGPQSGWTDSFRGDWQVYPGAGYVVAFPNPTGSSGYGQAYIDAISRDYGGRVMEEILAVTDALAKLPYVDAERMGAMGWSWGGYAMMWLEGQPTRFKALAAMMGLYDLRSFWGGTEELWFPEHDLGGAPWQSVDYERFSPSSRAEGFATPCLVVTGERDYRVPYTQSLQFFTALQKRGVPSRLVVLPKAGHWPGWVEMAFYYDLHLDWFHRYLGGGPAPWDPLRLLRNQVFEKRVGK